MHIYIFINIYTHIFILFMIYTQRPLCTTPMTNPTTTLHTPNDQPVSNEGPPAKQPTTAQRPLGTPPMLVYYT